LQENQGWEFGFISAWQSAGHKNFLIGFPPSAVIYWDLRNFFDPRSYKRKGHCDLPLPNYVGVNGEVSKNMYLDGGYPQQDLIEVESLRYLYLSNFSVHQSKRGDDISKGKTVLEVGDYLKENTYKQLNLLSSALADVEQSVRYIIKPHPACPVNMVDFPSLRGELSTSSIEELLMMSDVVYSSLITSPVIDAYCAGLPVITLLDGKTLNMSPLRGGKGVYFVKNSEDLSIAINTIEATDLDQKKHYFYLDPGLPRWHKWLIDDFDKNEQTEFKS
jgi:surface carbohydrate biosynthesis protein (TIGR04326 family)